MAGLVIAGGIAMVAGRAGSLAPSGRWGAVVVGTAATVAGWGWAALLVGWFVASSALTRFGESRKRARTASSLAPSGRRTALQVFANGGVFALCAVVGAVMDDARLSLMAVGALAAAAADTWATELGLLWGGEPRSIVGGGALAPGMSGGVTLVGFVASAAGALAVAAAGTPLVGVATHAVVATTATSGPVVLVVAAAGLLGSLVDSALGATLQARRFCASCARYTEREMHDCGARTTHARGWRWMTNDTVNLLATVAGAVAALGFGLSLLP